MNLPSHQFSILIYFVALVIFLDDDPVEYLSSLGSHVALSSSPSFTRLESRKAESMLD
jgi:hypothetical protein